jgi:hypothetical protein
VPAKHAVGVSTAKPIILQFAGAVSVVLFVDLVSVLASVVITAAAALHAWVVSVVPFTV